MARTTPLVIRLAAVSLVALAVMEAAPLGTSVTVVSKTTRSTQAITRPPRPRQRGRKKTTTTTTTIHPYDDEDEDFDDIEEIDEKTTPPPPTTTVDPRSLDYSKFLFPYNKTVN